MTERITGVALRFPDGWVALPAPARHADLFAEARHGEWTDAQIHAAVFRQARAALGLSQQEMAYAMEARGCAGVSQSTIRDLERGRFAPAPDRWRAILEMLQDQRVVVSEAVAAVRRVAP